MSRVRRAGQARNPRVCAQHYDAHESARTLLAHAIYRRADIEINPADFSHAAHREAAAVIAELRGEGAPVEEASVRGRIRMRADQFVSCGGADVFLDDLAGAAITANLDWHDVQVKRAARLRRLELVFSRRLEELRSDDDIDELINRTQRDLDEIGASAKPFAGRHFPIVKIGDVVDSGPPKFLIDQLWLDQGVGIVGGDPKSLKSFFTMFAAVHIALGKPLFGRAVTRGSVLVFNAEDTAELTRWRIGAICRALDVNIDDLDLRLIDTRALFLDDNNDVERLRATVAQARPRLLILDPLRSLHGLDENDSAMIARVLAPLRLLQRDYGCSVQVIHHLSKSNEGVRSPGSRLRGSGALRGWYDSAWIMDRAANGTVKLEVEHRGAKAPPSITFDLREKKPAAGNAITFECVGPPATMSRQDEKALAIVSALQEFYARNPKATGNAAKDYIAGKNLKIEHKKFWQILRAVKGGADSAPAPAL